MADERSTEQTHSLSKEQREYDESYYKEILPHIHGRVLDIGCGRGLFTVLMAEKADHIIAVDKFPSEERLQRPNIEHIDADITHCGLDGKYDCVVSTEFIEHIEKKDFIELINRIKGVLKEGGIFAGSTPDKVVPTTNPYHLYEYTLVELKGILQQNFMKVSIKANDKHCITWSVS